MKVSGRWSCGRGVVLVLALLLTSRVALAERVAVSALEGDPKGKLRAQVTSSLGKTRKVQGVPPAAWATAASKQGLTGPASVEPQAVSLLAPQLKVDAVLTGSVQAEGFNARLIDAEGQEVWSGTFPLKRGALPPKEASRLAQEVVTALKQRATPPPPSAPVEPPPAPAAPEPQAQVTPPAPTTPEPQAQATPPAPTASEPQAQVTPPTPTTPEPQAQATPPAPTTPPAQPAPAPQAQVPPAAETTMPPGPVVSAPATPTPVAQAPVAPRWVEMDAESHTYQASFKGSGGGFPEGEANGERSVSAGGPPRLRLLLGAAVTWRKYCARPGTASCAEYDARPEAERTGDVTDFSSSAPYVGISAQAEVFPLAHLTSPVRGIGLTLGLQRGFASTTVRVTSTSGSTPDRQVYAADTTYGAMLSYRYFIGLGGASSPLWAYAGLRLGVLGREFDVGETVEAPLPVVHRIHPAVGLDVSVPLMRAVRIEGSGEFFYRPVPGKSLLGSSSGVLLSEVRDYGQSVSSFGWAAQLGVAGDIWGPLGYSARFRLEHFQDTFSGSGTRRGWSAGGVAEDTFSNIQAGVTVAW